MQNYFITIEKDNGDIWTINSKEPWLRTTPNTGGRNVRFLIYMNICCTLPDSFERKIWRYCINLCMPNISPSFQDEPKQILTINAWLRLVSAAASVIESFTFILRFPNRNPIPSHNCFCYHCSNCPGWHCFLNILVVCLVWNDERLLWYSI